MAKSIGQLIKEVASSKGLSQKQFGEKINRTKQAVASIYKRSTIEIELLMLISNVLEYDFFAQLYEKEHLRKFKTIETELWHDRIESLNEKIASMDKLLENKEELLTIQRKYINELENKINRQ